MTGGAIINLLKRNTQIMTELEIACVDAFNRRQEDNLPVRPPPLATKEQLQKHRQLFQAQDAVYTHLRLIKPTAFELEETRTRINIMEK